MAHHSFRRRVVEWNSLAKCLAMIHQAETEVIHAMMMDGKLLVSREIYERMRAGDVLACEHVDKHASCPNGTSVWIDDLGILPIVRQRPTYRERRRMRWQRLRVRTMEREWQAKGTGKIEYRAMRGGQL